MGFERRDLLPLILLLVVILAARTPFILEGVSGNDAAYDIQAATTVLHGGSLYLDVPFTYPPLYAYTEALAIGAFGNTSVGWKMIAQIYDLGVVALIYLIVNRISSRNKAMVIAALYGFAPLPFFATSTFASFDSSAAFWMLLSLLLITMKKVTPSAVALGIGTAYKYFPLLLLPAVLVYLSTKRQRVNYTAASILTFATIQIPFIFKGFSSWLQNVILYQATRPAFGASLYNLISLHPQLLNTQTPLTIISPITIVLAFLLVIFVSGKSDVDLLLNSAFIMVTAVFFSKVVLFYALWDIPLIMIILSVLKKRKSVLILIPLLILQVALLTGWYSYNIAIDNQASLLLAYVYLAASGSLFAWLLYDRLISSKKMQQAMDKSSVS